MNVINNGRKSHCNRQHINGLKFAVLDCIINNRNKINHVRQQHRQDWWRTTGSDTILSPSSNLKCWENPTWLMCSTTAVRHFREPVSEVLSLPGRDWKAAPCDGAALWETWLCRLHQAGTSLNYLWALLQITLAFLLFQSRFCPCDLRTQEFWVWGSAKSAYRSYTQQPGLQHKSSPGVKKKLPYPTCMQYFACVQLLHEGSSLYIVVEPNGFSILRMSPEGFGGPQ